MSNLDKNEADRLRQSAAGQGDAGSLDEKTASEARALREQIGGRTDARVNWPFIWGTIRILGIYGTWSWWRDKARKFDDINPG